MDRLSNQRIFSRDQIRELDRRAIGEYGIPGIVLMENAARGLAQRALELLPAGGSVMIVCGGGNNGGDGLAAARHLHNAGARVSVVLTHALDRYTGDAGTNLKIARAMKLNLIDGSRDPIAVLRSIGRVDLILDGLLGTGLSERIRPPLPEVIQWMNGSGVPVLAIDIPSGLDCDTGLPLGGAVRALETVTFVGWKRGFLNPESRAYTGKISVVEIGSPRELAEELGAVS